jgi:hypothetical protein
LSLIPAEGTYGGLKTTRSNALSLKQVALSARTRSTPRLLASFASPMGRTSVPTAVPNLSERLETIAPLPNPISRQAPPESDPIASFRRWVSSAGRYLGECAEVPTPLLLEVAVGHYLVFVRREDLGHVLRLVEVGGSAVGAVGGPAVGP